MKSEEPSMSKATIAYFEGRARGPLYDSDF
jgi:hypothetical protein